jgi:two-component system cell cycle response regulator
MSLVEHFDPELEVSALSYAARLLFTDLEREGMIERALESLADLGHSDKVGLFILDRANGDLISQGCIRDGRAMVNCSVIPLAGSPLEEVIRNKRPAVYGLSERNGLPWPVTEGGEPGRECFCAPLVAVDFEVVGLVTLDHADDISFRAAEAQPLITYLTLLALGLETARLFRLAVTDGLTGLYVRRYFDIRLGEELSRINRYGGHLAILLMDLDHFKNINDTHGHIFGDEVLKITAATLTSFARRKIDIACRYGGEELVLILPSVDADGAWEMGERIRKDLESKMPQGPVGPVKVTISGGVAAVSGPTKLTAQDLFAQADRALYLAKQSGRNRVEVYKDISD